MSIVNSAIPEYSTEYLDSVQERFPEYQNHTQKDLISVLHKDKNREHGVYEEEVESAFKDLDQQISFPDVNDDLVNYVFNDLDPAFANKIASGITYVVQHGWHWDLVLWSRSKDKGQWRNTTVWAPVFPENFHFISSSRDPKAFEQWDTGNILLTLWVYSTGGTDSLWRKEYKLVPQLVEIPAKTALVMKWMMFKKDIDVSEFQESLKKLSA